LTIQCMAVVSEMEFVVLRCMAVVSEIEFVVLQVWLCEVVPRQDAPAEP
jgi:hypothetical protein